MKARNIVLLVAVPALVLCSCGEKKQTTDIIAPKPVERVAAGPVAMEGFSNSNEVEWIGKVYRVEITRSPDREMKIVEDGAGRYYDNGIVLRVVRPDDTVFFSRRFTKNDFAQLLDRGSLEGGVLLGLVFERADGDNLLFGASVGSPDPLSDEYVPFAVTLSRMGNVDIKKDLRLDIVEEGDDDL